MSDDSEKKRRKYNIEETGKKIIEALEEYKKHHKPGEHVGQSGSKTDVLGSPPVKSAMQNMIKEGYTPRQLAEAIKDGKLFTVRAKTITQTVNEPAPAKKPRQNKTVTVSAEPTEMAALPAATEKSRKARKPKDEAVSNSTAAFLPKPDSDDV